MQLPALSIVDPSVVGSADDHKVAPFLRDDYSRTVFLRRTLLVGALVAYERRA
jgi:hypothetical protein